VRPSELTPTQQEVWSGRLTAYTTCNTFAMRGLFDYLLRHYRGAARRFSRDVVHLHLRRSLPPPTPGSGGHGGGVALGGAAIPSEEAPLPPPPTPSPLPQPPAGTASSLPNGQSSSSSPAVLASPRTELPNFVNGIVSNWFQPDSPSGGIADGLFPNVVPVPSTPDVDEWVASEAGRLPLASALEQSGESSGAADLTPSLAAEVGDTLAGVGDVFVFSYGVIVTWGLSEVAEEAFTAQMADFEIGSLEGGAENEIFDYGYWSAGGVDGAGHPIPGVHAHGGPASAPSPAGGLSGGSGMETCVRIAQDTVLLSLGLPVDDMVQAKLAVSHAVAQSSKLASFESAVEGVFERIAHLPVSLAQTGRLNISDRELLRLSGELYTYRAYINLQTDILYVGKVSLARRRTGVCGEARGRRVLLSVVCCLCSTASFGLGTGTDYRPVFCTTLTVPFGSLLWPASYVGGLSILRPWLRCLSILCPWLRCCCAPRCRLTAQGPTRLLLGPRGPRADLRQGLWLPRLDAPHSRAQHSARRH